MSQGCPECVSLWREYGDATVAHIRLQSKLQVSMLEHDLEKADVLRVEVEKAYQLRNEWRDALRRHEAESHLKANAAVG